MQSDKYFAHFVHVIGHVHKCNPGYNFADEVQSAKITKFLPHKKFAPLQYTNFVHTNDFSAIEDLLFWFGAACKLRLVSYGHESISHYTMCPHLGTTLVSVYVSGHGMNSQATVKLLSACTCAVQAVTSLLPTNCVCRKI